MDFDLTDDQKEIKSVAKELLADRSPFAKVRQAAEGRVSTTPRCGASCASSAGRESRSPRSTAARASASSRSPCCSRSSATPAPRPRSLSDRGRRGP